MVNGITFASCSSGNPSPGYSLSQNTVASGIGLDYAVAGGECGQPLTVTLPAGATPVTAYLYVEYDIGSDTGSLNNSAVGFGSNTTPAGVVDGAPVTWTVFQNIYYNIRYGINPSWISGGGGGGSQTTYTVNTSANPNTCKGESLMVLYTNPTETSMNYVSIADGNNAWHAEENNTITAGNGVAPPDAQLNWSCMNPSCSNSSLKFSSLGGRDNCNDGALDGDEDQIEAYGQGGVTCGQGSENGNGGGCGGPPNTLWSGPPGVLNCGGTNTPGDYDRTYNLGNFQGGATSLEWGFNMQEQNAKASFWQQALVSQYQCNPTQQCSVTQAFNQNFIQSGWVQGTVTFGQGPWGESSSGVSFSGGCNGKNNFLINTNVTSGPGTLQVSMCTNNNGGNFSGLVFGYNTTTGNGYGLQFYNNGSGNPGELLWVQYTGGASSTLNTTNLANGAFNGCPYWVEVDVNASCQYSVKIASTQAGLSSAPVTATYTGGSCTTGYMGLSANNCENSIFQSFQFTGNCSTPTPTNTPTRTPTPTATQTATSSATSSATSTTTRTATASATSSATRRPFG